MQDYTSGAFKGNRQASSIARGSWVFPLAALTSAADVKLCTLPGSTPNPIAYRVRAVVITASDAATTDVLRIGTAAGGTTLLNDVSLKAAANTNHIVANDPVFISKGDVDLYIRETITGAKTVGEFAIIVEPFELNVASYNTLEA